MDEIQARLQETSQNCLKAYAEWADKKRDHKAQETLHAAIHELRKVASRLEIDLAVNERDQITSKPLPIPSHRSIKDVAGGEDADFEDEGQDFGNGGSGGSSAPKPRRRPQHHQHQQRRPIQGGGGSGSGGGGQQQPPQ